MEIEKGIPIFDGRPRANAQRIKYPWADLEVGDSFFAEINTNALRTNSLYHAKKLNKEFVIRKDGNGSRAWRVK